MEKRREREREKNVTEFELERCGPGSPLTSDAATGESRRQLGKCNSF